jgi:transcriptional regulator with XRE-family HTH domain
VRERRLSAGLSQQQLAQMIGVAYQQAHKYERGLNRISAGRLYQIAAVLRVPISWFFEGLDQDPLALKAAPTPVAGRAARGTVRRTPRQPAAESAS